MGRTLRLLAPLVAVLVSVATPPAEAAGIRMLDPAAPGRLVELEAVGLEPGGQVSVALLPTLSARIWAW